MKKTPDKLSRDLQDQVQIALLTNVIRHLKKAGAKKCKGCGRMAIWFEHFSGLCTECSLNKKGISLEAEGGESCQNM